jgi:hypothetical protein
LIEVTDVPRQTRATLELSSLPQATFWDRASAKLRDIPYELAVPAALGVLMFSLIGFGLMRRRGPADMDATPDLVEEQATERSTIIEEMAELEEAFENGKLRETDYHLKRQALLARLSAQASQTTSD